jgi:hypothetical protein
LFALSDRSLLLISFDAVASSTASPSDFSWAAATPTAPAVPSAATAQPPSGKANKTAAAANCMRMKLYSISNKNDVGICPEHAAKIWQTAHKVQFGANSDSI